MLAFPAFLRRILDRSRRRKHHRRFARRTSNELSRSIQALEDRTLLATYTVVNTDDSGAGSLRDAINQANVSAGLDTIVFDLPANDPGHFYYQDDNIAGQVSIANVMATTAVDDSAIADIDPDWAHSWWSIRPDSGLPTITETVTIDGYTQSGASENTNTVESRLGLNTILRVELDGTNAGNVNGLQITGGDSIVRGLVINRFRPAPSVATSGIRIESGGGNHVEGNFIGTDISGTLPVGPTHIYGVYLSSPDNTVGSTDPSGRNLISNTTTETGFSKSAVEIYHASGNVVQGNLIGTDITGTAALPTETGVDILQASGNTIGGTSPGAGNLISGAGTGIFLTGSSVQARDNVIQGNLIGTDISGTSDLGNNQGIALNGADDNLIGGTTAQARNVISGNGPGFSEAGISFSSTATGNRVQGNLIGTQIDGVSPLGNRGGGIVFNSSSANNNTIGGTASGAGNVIAFNGRSGGTSNGIEIGGTPTGIAILGNSIHSNIGRSGDSGLGIEIGSLGPNLNDSGDADTGANNLQNYPVITSATVANSTTITGALNSAPNTTFRVEFFASSVADPTGYGEGETFLGFSDVTTDADGNADFDVTLPVTVTVGHLITATATDPGGNTSEFSVGINAIAAPTEQTFIVVNTNDSGTGSLRDAIDQANANPVPDTIEFDSSLAGTIISLTSGPISITDDLKINGLGADQLTISGNNTVAHIFDIDNKSTSDISVEISGLTITAAAGTGITLSQEDLLIQDSTISNHGGSGIGGSGDLTVINSTITGNSSSFGGGINFLAGDLTIIQSTISGNSASTAAGAIHLFLLSARETNLTVIQSTITGNSSLEAGPGIVVNATNAIGTESITIANSIVAGNLDGIGDVQVAVNSSSIVPSIQNSLVQADASLILDPALADNGGPTPTHALLAGSPANDAGDNQVAIDAGLSFDQRGDGFQRVLGAAADLGAVESTPEPDPLHSISGQKYHDYNRNGDHDPGEPGLNGWTIQLFDVAGNLIAETTTAGDVLNGDGQIDPETERGLYSFTDLPEGDYTVREVQKPGWVQTEPGPDFSSSIQVDVGDVPLSVISADFNGDGHLDLAVANQSSNTVSVLLNNNDGTFRSINRFAGGEGPHSVTAGDFDLDGDLDLAVANVLSDNVSVLLNRGNGTFDAPISTDVGNLPVFVSNGDIDGDGDLDLVVAYSSSDRIGVLYNKGDGSFVSIVSYDAGPGASSAAVGDLNGDGNLDLAVINRAVDQVSILLNNGTGNFNSLASKTVGDIPVSLTAADLDGDGDLDLAVVNQFSSNISVLLNRGNGTFRNQVNYEAGFAPRSIATGDLDRDGDLDLAVVSAFGDVTILPNNGNGTFGSGATFTGGSFSQSLTPGDFDDDGDLDLAVTSQLSDTVSILWNEPGSYHVTISDGDVTELDFGNKILQQVVFPDEPELDVPQHTGFNVVANYTTTDRDPTLSGLGLRLHYDSSVMTFNRLTSVLDTDLVQQQILDDVNDYDNDPATDKFLLVGWSNLQDNWPNTRLATELYTANFQLVDDVPVGTDSTLNFTAASTAVTHSFWSRPVNISVIDANLDVDDNGRLDALTDGILILRYLFGFRGPELTNNSVASDAQRSSFEAIEEYLDAIALSILDVDANGEANALTDGASILRYLLGFRGANLIDGVVDPSGLRVDAQAVFDYLEEFNPHPFSDGTVSALPEVLPALRQIINATPTERVASPGELVQFDVTYSTDVLDESLLGLGMRMHFDSSQITFVGLANRFDNGFLLQQVLPDTEDFDDDPTTDSFVLVAYFDVSGRWTGEGSQPQRLFTGKFIAGDIGFDSSTTINMTASSTSRGAEFEGDSVSIRNVPAVVNRWVSLDRSGFWDDPTNWSTGFVPRPIDDVEINVAGINAEIIVPVGDFGVHSLMSNEKLILNGTLHVEAGSELRDLEIAENATFEALGGLQISEGTSTNAGDLVLGGAFTLNSAAVLRNFGAIELTSSLNVSEFSRVENQGLISADEILDFRISETSTFLNFATGTVALSFAPDPGDLEEVDVVVESSSTLRNFGVMTLASIEQFDLTGSSTVENMASAAFTVTGRSGSLDLSDMVTQPPHANVTIRDASQFQNSGSTNFEYLGGITVSGTSVLTNSADATFRTSNLAQIVEGEAAIQLNLNNGLVNNFGNMIMDGFEQLNIVDQSTLNNFNNFDFGITRTDNTGGQGGGTGGDGGDGGPGGGPGDDGGDDDGELAGEPFHPDREHDDKRSSIVDGWCKVQNMGTMQLGNLGRFSISGNSSFNNLESATLGLTFAEGADIARSFLLTEASSINNAGDLTLTGVGNVTISAESRLENFQNSSVIVEFRDVDPFEPDFDFKDHSVILNEGLLELSNLGDFAASNGSTLQNQESGFIRMFTTDVAASIESSISLSASLFENLGRLELAQGALAINGSGDFLNHGQVQVLQGALKLGNGSSTGRFQVSEGAALNFAGSFVLEAGSVFSGEGLVRIAPPTDSGALVRTVDTLNLSNVDVGEFGTLQIQAGITTIFNGSSAGTFQIAENAELLFAGPFNFAEGATVTGSGLVRLEPLLSGSIVTVAGDLSLDNVVIGPQADIRTIGTLTTSSDLVVTGTQTLGGAGTIRSTVTNSSAIRPGFSPGALTIDGDYNQTAEGMLEIEIAGTIPGDEHDQLNVTGTAILDGTLEILVIDDFVPSHGDEFVILTFADRVGDFATINGLNAGSGFEFEVRTTEAAVRLVALDIEPPSFGAGTLTATNVTENAATLTWTPAADNDEIAEFVIFQNGSEIGTTTPDTLTFEATGLISGTVYDFTVEALDAASNISGDGPVVEVETLEGNGNDIIVTGVGFGSTPTVRVSRARTNEELFTFGAYETAFGGGVRVATGDVNGDGAPDIITAAGPGGGPHVKVFDGTNPSRELYSFFAFEDSYRAGLFVAAGDLDGDDRADIIVGTDTGSEPRVRVFSGSDGEELFSFLAYDERFLGGVRVAAGDISGDGIRDIITGAGPGGGPHVRVFDGTTGDQIPGPAGSFFAYNENFRGGVFVSAGRVNADLQVDVITGAGIGGGPHVRVFDGASGSQLPGAIGSFFAFDDSFRGGVRVAASDLNGDGQADVLAAQGPGGDTRFRAFDANSDGAQLVELLNQTREDVSPLGLFVAGTTEISSASSLRLAEGFVPQSDAPTLNQADAEAVFDQALERLQSDGVPDATIAELSTISLEVRDLGGDQLGQALPGRIVIDTNAAGTGWFVDSTRNVDEEFDVIALRATDSEAIGQVDLLSVILHELGHHLGLDHQDDGESNHAMAERLEPGSRILFDNESLDEIFSERNHLDNILDATVI